MTGACTTWTQEDFEESPELVQYEDHEDEEEEDDDYDPGRCIECGLPIDQHRRRPPTEQSATHDLEALCQAMARWAGNTKRSRDANPNFLLDETDSDWVSMTCVDWRFKLGPLLNAQILDISESPEPFLESSILQLGSYLDMVDNVLLVFGVGLGVLKRHGGGLCDLVEDIRVVVIHGFTYALFALMRAKLVSD
jgi:hypothetical protein